MTELERLMAEQKRIQDRIKELKKVSLVSGRARLGLDHYATTKKDEWYISIERILDVPPCVGRDMKRYSIIRATDKDEAISHIDEIIHDLQGLKEKYLAQKGE